MTIDLAIYPLDVVMRASHAFTARGSVFIRSVDDRHAVVELRPYREGIDGEFANALLDAQLRAQIAAETKWIRELIVAQAFCEADLLDRSDIEGDESIDSRGITR